ncbi:glycosyltransferase, partial [bacterium AH-315-P15]|nr:glycosyltransferase [bacterium AH-315-P15]
RAENVFVLSPYAVREKEFIFGLRSRYFAGALTCEKAAEAGKKALKVSSDGVARLVTLSRLDKNKRIDVVLDALALLRSKGIDVSLSIAGTGPAECELREYAKILGVERNVEFLGYVAQADVPALYAKMDLLVTVDWADFRITTYEALAENRQVIVSDDTDADAELVASGYLFVSAANGKTLAEVIQQAISTHPSWGADRLAAYLKHFTWAEYFSSIQDAVSPTT